MKKLALAAALVAAMGVGYVAHAQVQGASQKPYRNGSVWDIGFIQVQPGMDNAYLTWLATDWKKMQDAAKKEGLILSYKVLSTENHGADDWNLVLMTEYKDLATMEANEAKGEALMLQMVGGQQKSEQGMKDRNAIRHVVGGRLAREIVLAPKPGA